MNKLIQKSPIVIIGQKCVGKTFFADALAKKLNKNFHDVDAEIEKKENLSAREIVKQKGINYFRAQEVVILKNLLLIENSVIALGAGAITTPEIQTLLQPHIVIHLTEKKEIVLARIQSSQGVPAYFDPHKTFQENADFFWKIRAPIYDSLATLSISHHDSIEKKLNSIQVNMVAGSPIAYSESPAYHGAFYKKNKCTVVMIKMLCTDSEKLIKTIIENNIVFTAVTMPLKEKVIAYMDVLDTCAKKTGIVNTIIYHHGRLHGYNTDIIGIDAAFSKINCNNKSVLIIGAGAVAKLMGHFFSKKTKHLFWHNRTFSKADHCADIFGGKVVTPEILNQTHIDIIVNTTPIGMQNDSDIPLNARMIQKNQIVFDVVYHPRMTPFLSHAAQAGATIISGWEMFCAQANAQTNLWMPVYDELHSQTTFDHIF